MEKPRNPVPPRFTCCPPAVSTQPQDTPFHLSPASSTSKTHDQRETPWNSACDFSVLARLHDLTHDYYGQATAKSSAPGSVARKTYAICLLRHFPLILQLFRSVAVLAIVAYPYGPHVGQHHASCLYKPFWKPMQSLFQGSHDQSHAGIQRAPQVSRLRRLMALLQRFCAREKPSNVLEVLLPLAGRRQSDEPSQSQTATRQLGWSTRLTVWKSAAFKARMLSFGENLHDHDLRHTKGIIRQHDPRSALTNPKRVNDPVILTPLEIFRCVSLRLVRGAKVL